jgi:hypothetical protein
MADEVIHTEPSGQAARHVRVVNDQRSPSRTTLSTSRHDRFLTRLAAKDSRTSRRPRAGNTFRQTVIAAAIRQELRLRRT